MTSVKKETLAAGQGSEGNLKKKANDYDTNNNGGGVNNQANIHGAGNSSDAEMSAMLEDEVSSHAIEEGDSAAGYARDYAKVNLTPEYVRGALMAIDPDSLSRDEWVSITYSLRAIEQDNGLDLCSAWEDWNDRYSNTDARADVAVWKSCGKPTRITAGTLFKYAADSGWRPDTKSAPLRERSADQIKAIADRKKKEAKESAALTKKKQESCNIVWERADENIIIAERYFDGRGELTMPENVFKVSTEFVSGDGEVKKSVGRGRYNILSRIRSFETGEPVGLHVNGVLPSTQNLAASHWSVDNAKMPDGKKARFTCGNSVGYIELAETDSRVLVVAEGVETALSALKLPLGFNNPNIRALVNEGNFKKMPAEDSFDTLMILADIEESGAGRRAADALAATWVAAGQEVRIVEAILAPNQSKRDLNNVVQDCWREGREAEEGRDYTVRVFEADILAPDAVSSIKSSDEQIRLTDFYAFAPRNQFIHTPSGSLWPAKSVDTRITPISLGGKKKIKPSDWLSANRSVESMTWAPGEPELIEGRLFVHAGWISHAASNTYNDYKPAILRVGNAGGAGKWIDHIHTIYPDGADRIISFFAHRVQKPGEKINYILNLGGPPKQGKDTILEPVMHAVGRHNCAETTPKIMLSSPYNAYERSVILRISEIHDLGDHSRFELYEHLKIIAAAPPNVVAVNDKYTPIYYIANVTGIVSTTNHKHALFLPPDDRRNECWWVAARDEEFSEQYWNSMYAWYDSEGYDNVAYCLQSWDLSKFNPKAAPEKTSWFWEIVEAGRDSEESELSDVIDRLSNKDAFRLQDLINLCMGSGLADWLQDRKHRRTVGHRLEKCGYGAVRNPDAKDGLWVIMGERKVVYVRNQMAEAKRLDACRDYVAASEIC